MVFQKSRCLEGSNRYISSSRGRITRQYIQAIPILASQLFFLRHMIRLSQQISNWTGKILHKSVTCYINDKDEARFHPVQGHFPSQSMGSYTYSPRSQSDQLLSEEEIEKEARSIFEWAKSKGADRYSFIAYPHTDGIFEKQDSFLNLQYTMDKRGFKETVTYEFPGSILTKGEGDGSSVPSGGLRQTHTARAYMLWDSHSNLYVRRRNRTLYIPSLLVCHDGKALDMKTLFRMSEKALQKATMALLKRIGIETPATKLFVGLQQEFFVIPTEDFEKREDLKWLGRTLVGTNPRRNQQLGEHYYAKLPRVLEKALADIEQELLEIGIPFKTRHNEVAINQFQIACIYGETGITIDQNVLLMQIMKETFERYGLTALFHEKPFRNINGSGKHANYNLAYVEKNGSIKNVFKQSSSDTPHDTLVYKLFMLIQLMAAMKHEKLYMTALATPGNEVRLGGHEAPPRIFSVFLGDGASNLLDGKPAPVAKNLRKVINTLNYDVYQQNSDRNRTSPFAYTGRVFEFRALGSSQNAAFPMAVIAATMCCEVEEVIKLLDSGKTIEQVIESYVEQTRKIRFDGNGYSKEWREEAKKRGLYVNEKFSELYTFLQTEQSVFIKIGVSTPQQNLARFQIAKSSYNNTVTIEAETLIYIGRRHIIPQGFNYLKSITGDCQESALSPYYKEIKTKLQNSVTQLSAFQELMKKSMHTLSDCQNLREQIHRVGDVLTKLITMLPNNKEFPDQSTFLNL